MGTGTGAAVIWIFLIPNQQRTASTPKSANAKVGQYDGPAVTVGTLPHEAQKAHPSRMSAPQFGHFTIGSPNRE